MNPKISVVIPAYNSEKTLRQCLESVLKQQYSDFEVIAVDNDSGDNTKKIIMEAREKDNRIKYIFCPQRSSGAARNAGIDAAEGEIIVFTDSDCLCPDGWLGKITQPISEGKEEAATGSEYDLANNYWSRNIQKADQLYMQRCSNGAYTSIFDTKNTAIRAALIKSLKFDPKINFTDDLELSIRFNRKIRYLEDARVGHWHRSGFTGLARAQFIRAFWTYKVYKKHKAALAQDIRFESMHFKNWLIFPFWACLNFCRKPWGEAYFILVSELSWRFGLLFSILKE